jgi:hypothetical protein
LIFLNNEEKTEKPKLKVSMDFLTEMDQLIAFQKKKIYENARILVPHITPDDLLQLNDFPLLDNHPYLRYEEGVLEGLLTARMIFLAQRSES